MMRRLFFVAAFLLAAAGCSDPAVPNNQIENGRDSVTSTIAATAEPPTAAPSATAVPSRTPQPTPTPKLTETPLPPPTETAAPNPTALATTSPDVQEGVLRDLIWLPFGFGAYGEPLTGLQDGKLLELAEPVPPIEAFFDSHPSGRILYGAEFWAAAANDIDSVTDLWLAPGSFEGWDPPPLQLFEGEIGRAAFNPASEMGWPIAVALHNGADFDLMMQFGNGNQLIAAEGIEPFFSWSPDGEQFAYIKNGGLYLLDPLSFESSALEVNLRDADFGWVGDAPVWGLERGVIFYPADPFLIIPLPETILEQTSPFVPLLPDDDALFDNRPSAMLWSPELNQLIVQQEDEIFDVQIYLLSSDLSFIEDSYFLEGAELVGWIEVGRTIAVLDEFGGPIGWDLAAEEYFEIVK